MIPIGTRCILLRAWILPKRAGTTCVVTRHQKGTARDGGTYECLIRHDDPALADKTTADGEWATEFRYLIPIGHDPDTETRTTDREVTA